LALAAFLFSGQAADLSHSIRYSDGLIKHGLSFYRIALNDKSLGVGDYLPSLYGLLQVALIPATFVERIFGLHRCGVVDPNGMDFPACLVESLALKAVILLLAVGWIAILVNLRPSEPKGDLLDQANALSTTSLWPRTLKLALYLISMPTILYSVILFGAHDGLGAFATLLGSLQFFRAEELAGQRKWQQGLISLCGLTLMAMGVGAKFFPIVLLLGSCIAFARTRSKAVIGLGVPGVITIAQILLAWYHGGTPLRMVERKVAFRSGLELYPKLLAILLILGFLCYVCFAARARMNRASLGALVALGIYSIGFPSLTWHPQWQIYYGIALAVAFCCFRPHGLLARLLILLISVQGLAFACAVQHFTSSADVTMTFAMFSRMLVPPMAEALLDNTKTLVGVSWKFFSISQLTILALFAANIRSPGMKEGVTPSLMSLRPLRSSYLIPGFTFIIFWYLLAGLSAYSSDYSRYRLKLSTAKISKLALAKYQPSHREAYISLENSKDLEFSLEAKADGPTNVTYGYIRMGNNHNTSKGTLEVCFSMNPSELAHGESGRAKHSEDCAHIALGKTIDNAHSLFVFSHPPLKPWTSITLHTSLMPGTPAPVLWLDSASRPDLLLFEAVPGGLAEAVLKRL
jgi:hypothetical protein